MNKIILTISTGLCLLPTSQPHDEIITQQQLYIEHLEEQNKTLKSELEKIGFEHLQNPTTIYPDNQPSTFKSFMDYRAITDTKSKQWRYRVHGYTLDNGLRGYKGRVQVALGTPYGQVGDKIDVHLDSGKVIYGVISDSKGDRYFHKDGSTIEFLVDSDLIPFDWRLDKGLDVYYKGLIEKLEVENATQKSKS